MRLKPNRSLLEARVLGMQRCADGVGAELRLEVLRCEPLPPAEDFIQAEPGAEITVFATIPEAVAVAGTYCFEASVLGGPGGERIVIERTSDKAPPARPPTRPR